MQCECAESWEGRKGWLVLGSAHSLWGCSDGGARGREAKKLFELSAEEAKAVPMRQSKQDEVAGATSSCTGCVLLL